MENMQSAIDALVEARRKAVQQYDEYIAGIDRAITKLREGLETTVTSSTNPIQAGEYKGLKPAGALQAYLLRRGGGPLPFQQAFNDLITAGVIFGEQKNRDRWERNMKIMMNNNSKTFDYDADRDTVALVDVKRRMA